MEISKILLVDDDAFVRRVAQITLSNVGKWDVYPAGSGAEAIQLLPQVNPDLILLDVMMPGMDGPTTLLKIRETYGRDIPVIFMTAKVQQHEIEKYRTADADGVISKPFDPITLPEEIKSILSKRQSDVCKSA